MLDWGMDMNILAIALGLLLLHLRTDATGKTASYWMDFISKNLFSWDTLISPENRWLQICIFMF